jgi:hypothetical protein
VERRICSINGSQTIGDIRPWHSADNRTIERIDYINGCHTSIVADVLSSLAAW